MEGKRQGISPAPIFRKKPRQALLAHPNNINTEKGENRRIYDPPMNAQGLNSPCGQFGARQPETQMNKPEFTQQQSEPFGFQQTSFRPQRPVSLQQTPVRMPNQYMGRNMPAAQQQNQPRATKPYPPPGYQQSPNRQTLTRPGFQQQQNNLNATHPVRFEPRPTTMNPGPLPPPVRPRLSGYNTTMNPGPLPPPVRPRLSGYNTTMNSGPLPPPVRPRLSGYNSTMNSGPLPPPVRPRLSGYTGSRSQVMNPTNNSNSLLFGDQKITMPRATVQAKVPMTQQWGAPMDSSVEDGVNVSKTGTSQFKQAFGHQSVTRKREDQGMRVITASVLDMRQLSQHKSSVVILFEIMGMVNSAVSSTGGNLCREFLLKEGQDTIKCVFYEIDREMPRVTRGQWCRCVGSASSSVSGIVFRCVSVRPASNAERQCHTRYGDKCKTTVREILAQNKEM